MKYYLKQKLVSLHHALKIFDGQDDVVYEVESKMFSLHDKTYLRDAAGNEVAYLACEGFQPARSALCRYGQRPFV